MLLLNSTYLCIGGMKTKEKQIALRLRQEGHSMNDIAREVGVSKASISLWVRDVRLSREQRKRLTLRGFSVDAIEKRRASRLARTQQERALLMEDAGRDIPSLSQEALWLIGVALYWGEGSKTHKGMARVTNSDPAVIKMMMRFFREVCAVPEEKFRGHIHTFSHLNAKKAERYWSKVSGIPPRQFFKTYIKQSVASKNKRDSLPYGTFEICVCDTKLFYRILGWIGRYKELSD